MSKKEIFTKNLVTPKEALSKCFRIGALVYFKDGSYVVKKSDQSDFAMTVGCLEQKVKTNCLKNNKTSKLTCVAQKQQKRN